MTRNMLYLWNTRVDTFVHLSKKMNTTNKKCTIFSGNLSNSGLVYYS